MKKSKKWLYGGMGLLLSIVLILAGCSSNQSANNKESDASSEKQSGEKVLKVALPGNASNLDPQFAASAPDLTVTQPIFNGLVQFKTGSTSIDDIEGVLAESWGSNDDATAWTFQLREGVQWHHGYGEFTSEDVKWTYERVLDPETGSAFRSDVINIKEVQTPDPYTVVFQLNEPDLNFPLTIVMEGATGAGGIVKKEAIEDAGKNFMVKPVGTGPFMLKEYKLNEKVILEKNPDYFKGEPKLDKIEFITMTEQNAIDIAIEKGEIHLATGVGDPMWLDKMRSKQGIELDIPDPPLPWVLHLNKSVKPLDDIKVRKAIAHAIDMKKYVEEVVGPDVGELASGVIASNMFGHADLGVYEYDPELSKKLLAEAGYPDGLKLPDNFVNTRSSYTNIMTYVQEELRKVGITTELKQADIPTYQANIRKNLNNLVLYTKSFKPHASYPIDAFYESSGIAGTPTAKQNFSHYDLSDELIEQAKKETDSAKAEKLYEEIQKQIMEDYAVIPLIETKSPLLRRDTVDLGYDLQSQMIYSYPIIETTDLKN